MKKDGFEFIELMIVVAIVAIIAAIAVPAVMSVRKEMKAERAAIEAAAESTTAAEKAEAEAGADTGPTSVGGTDDPLAVRVVGPRFRLPEPNTCEVLDIFMSRTTGYGKYHERRLICTSPYNYSVAVGDR